MAQKQLQSVQAAYDPRWFVWTIVFLLLTGVSLVCYIVVTDDSHAVESGVISHVSAEKPN